ncbi:hypothetical protein [uncultured Sutterella sp.]|uniref:hypothetical protein n=1 Tax=uncultured Sutterella sp. TaxID=286133 RepID=UPI00259BC071|nr:hypothetical protein [uncultured Sutterella sp.]
MTTLTASSLFGFTVERIGDEDRLRRKLNRILERIQKEARLCVLYPAQLVDLQFDTIINEANNSLQEISKKIVFSDARLQHSFSIVNQVLNNDSQRNRIDPEHTLDLLVPCILGITEQIIVFVRSVRFEIEAQNINRLSISESICLLSQIENQLSDIFSKTQKLHEIVRISDAMVEPPKAVCGIPELDALNA